MFIRKKANPGGSHSVLLVTGVRIPGKKHPVSKIIKNFGSAKDKKTLDGLLNEAKQYKAHLEASNPKAQSLKLFSDQDIDSCRSYNIGFEDVYGRTFDTVFKQLPLSKRAWQTLKDLTVLRIAQPASKRKTASVGIDYNKHYGVDDFYQCMDHLTPTCIEAIKTRIYQQTKQRLAQQRETVDVLFYDLTTVYFETSTQDDDLRDFGFSKDGKHQHVQVMLAMIVTKEGLPIDYETFPGRTFEGHTLLPVMNSIREKYGIRKAVVVADAALMNTVNLSELETLGIQYVIAARIKNTTRAIKARLLSPEEYQEITRETNREGHCRDVIKAKAIVLNDRSTLMAFHSTKRARKDKHDRAEAIEKIHKYLGSTVKNKLTGKLKKAYVSVSKDAKIILDNDKLLAEAQYDGLFAFQTNLENPDPAHLLRTYRGLWQVEQTFRIAKSTLEIRPVYHYTPRRIRGHFAICYMALALVRFVEFALKTTSTYLPTDTLHLMLHRMRKVQIKQTEHHTFEILEDPPPELLPIYQALNIPWPKKFQHKPIL